MADLKIYYLKDPDGTIFYVGVTGQHYLSNRLKVHNHTLKKKCTIHLLDTVDEVGHPQKSLQEEYWIQQMIAWGFPLVNQYKTAGGYITKKGTRDKLSKQAKKQFSNMKYRNAQSESMKKIWAKRKGGQKLSQM